MKAEETEVLIVGAGPVGLFLARRLHQLDISCIVLEKRAQLSDESRSIGIHAPSLEMLSVMGLAESFVSAGCPVMRGIAFARGRQLGTVNFSRNAQPFNYILTLSQGITMRLLAEGADIRFEHEASVFDAHAQGVQLSCSDVSFRARHLVACDGAQSWIRNALKITWKGGAYRTRYFMGDFPDDTALGNAAGIFLEPGGLVESFPLRENQRRWVAQRAEGDADTLDTLVQTVQQRTGHVLNPERNAMFRAFQVERYRARTCRLGPILLAGDAAHITSPFGGQGMNLGWMDAWEVAEVLAGRMPPEAYQVSVRKRALRGIRRAEFNMLMGSFCKTPRLKEAVVKALLHSPAQQLLARQFTMRGLPIYNAPPGGG